jgi:hypothetical protein
VLWLEGRHEAKKQAPFSNQQWRRIVKSSIIVLSLSQSKKPLDTTTSHRQMQFARASQLADRPRDRPWGCI